MKPSKPKSKFLEPKAIKVRGVKSTASGDKKPEKGTYKVRQSGINGPVIVTSKTFPAASIAAQSFPGSWIDVNDD